MPKGGRYIFVLWGDYFDEAAAAIFVTELRRAGLRVKVVGLTQRPISGAHGLVLTPDLSLAQALPLAKQALGLIIPCALSVAQQLWHDPRLADFITQLRAGGARLVSGPGEGAAGGVAEAVGEAVLVYPEHEDLVRFVRAWIEEGVDSVPVNEWLELPAAHQG